MGQVWVNGKILETYSKKIEKWKPDAEQEKVLCMICPDCNEPIYELDSCWPMVDKTVCVFNGCWEKYYEQGLGFHDSAALVLPEMTLEI